MRLFKRLAVAGLFLQAHAKDCPGYHVVAAQDDGSTLTADLRLSGEPCNLYGEDLPKLKLQVEYQTGRLLSHQCSFVAGS